MKVELKEQAFDPWVEAQGIEAALSAAGTSFGATSVFIGTMRDFNDGEAVSAMTLEHYPGMTERSLVRVLEQATSAHAIIDGVIVHRVGTVQPGEPIVLVAIWAAHRAAAFAACRQVIEDLKTNAPFWKKETRTTGEKWVEHNTPG